MKISGPKCSGFVSPAKDTLVVATRIIKIHSETRNLKIVPKGVQKCNQKSKFNKNSMKPSFKINGKKLLYLVY